MSSEYEPNSLNATLARFEAKFDAHVSNTEAFRKDFKQSVEDIHGRVSDLEGDKKKLLGIAIGGGVGAGGLGAVLGKLFGS